MLKRKATKVDAIHGTNDLCIAVSRAAGNIMTLIQPSTATIKL